MVEIIYLWVENYKQLNNFGINLSGKHRFDMTTENDKLILKHQINLSYCEKFFAENLEIFAIVGENGTGKTTISDAIGEFFFSNPINYIPCRFVRVIKDATKKLQVQFFDNILPINDFEFVPSKENMSLFERNVEKSYFAYSIDIHNSIMAVPPLTNTIGVYFSHSLDSRYLSTRQGLIDISTNGALQEICNKNPINVEYDLVTQYFWGDFKKQVDFVTEFADCEKYLGFNFPDGVVVEFANFNDEMKKIIIETIRFGRIYNENEFEKCLHNFMKSMGTEKFDSEYGKDNSLYMFLKYFSSAIKFAVIKGIDFQSKASTSEFNILKAERNDKINDLDYIENVLERLIATTKNNKYRKYLKFIAWLKNNIHEIKENFAKPLKETDIIKVIFNDFNKTDFGFFGKFLKEYQKTIDDNSFMYLNFSWSYPMSTGEQTLLTLFSRLYYLQKENKLKSRYCASLSEENPYSITVFIDELDVALHPKWQQKIVQDLTQFIPIFFERKDSVKVIITTHSPIVLSDIPKQNTIILAKDNNHIVAVQQNQYDETFAANVSNLFYSSFLLQCGSIGLFAKSKIDKIIRGLTQLKSDCENQDVRNLNISEKCDVFSKQIDLIGEPIIRRKLHELLDECLFNSKDGVTSTEQQKAVLKRRLERAQKEYDMFKDGDGN